VVRVLASVKGLALDGGPAGRAVTLSTPFTRQMRLTLVQNGQP